MEHGGHRIDAAAAAEAHVVCEADQHGVQVAGSVTVQYALGIYLHPRLQLTGTCIKMVLMHPVCMMCHAYHFRRLLLDTPHRGYAHDEQSAYEIHAKAAWPCQMYALHAQAVSACSPSCQGQEVQSSMCALSNQRKTMANA